jgi:hypothetical protein
MTDRDQLGDIAARALRPRACVMSWEKLRLLAALFAELLDGVQENLLKIRLGLEADDDGK